MCPASDWQIQVLGSHEVTPTCLWTSTQKLQDKGVDDVFIVEFCSLFNRALHHDIADVMQHLVVIVCAINALCIVQRDEAMLKFPLNAVSLRAASRAPPLLSLGHQVSCQSIYHRHQL